MRGVFRGDGGWITVVVEGREVVGFWVDLEGRVNKMYL